MTYLTFLLVFIVPPIAILLAIRRSQQRRHRDVRRWAIPATALIALVYTTPWDNYLVYRGVWTYGADRVLATIGYVPVEEYLFFVLQPILTGLFLRVLLHRAQESGQTPWHCSRLTYFWGAASVVGWVFLLLPSDALLYAGLILGWAGPVLAGLTWYGGAHAEKMRAAVLPAILIPTLYLWVCDRIAIGLDIWTIPPTYSTGWHILGLPVEEALFFFVTNVLSVLGVLLFAHGHRISPPPIVMRLVR